MKPKGRNWWRTVRWNNNLVAVVTQDIECGAVLTLTWSNRDALVRALTLGGTHFFSRSRQIIWSKGRQSGNNQFLLKASADCDSDAVLMTVGVWSDSCHSGRFTCFFGNIRCDSSVVLGHVTKVGMTRWSSRKSYTESQLVCGTERMLRKIAEEAVEMSLVHIKQERVLTVKEAGDLIYHLFLALMSLGVQPCAIVSELKGRMRLSGSYEKVVRSE